MRYGIYPVAHRSNNISNSQARGSTRGEIINGKGESRSFGKQVLPLLIEGLNLMDEKKYREAYARINDAVVIIGADLVPETNIEDITEQVLKKYKK